MFLEVQVKEIPAAGGGRKIGFCNVFRRTSACAEIYSHFPARRRRRSKNRTFEAIGSANKDVVFVVDSKVLLSLAGFEIDLGQGGTRFGDKVKIKYLVPSKK